MTERPIRIQRKRTKGWKMPARTRYCGRGSIFGNPFELWDDPGGHLHTRAGAVDRFTRWLDGTLTDDELRRSLRADLQPARADALIASLTARRARLLAGLPELLTYDYVSCWCSADDGEPCHVDVEVTRARASVPATSGTPRDQEGTMPSDPDDEDPIHGWFGLSYANYLVLPRTLLQSMPAAWQRRFVACLTELDAAFAHVEKPSRYNVQPAEERELNELSRAELKQLGYTRSRHVVGEAKFWDERGTEREGWERVIWPTGDDPIPHYDRGRAFVPPIIAGDQEDAHA